MGIIDTNTKIPGRDPWPIRQAREEAIKRDVDKLFRKEKHKRTVYQKILRAAESNKGCRLSAKECHKLAADDAIRRRGEQDDMDKATPNGSNREE